MRSRRIIKPLIGISCCTKQFGTFGMPNHAASDTYVRATDQVVGGVPVLIPANGPTTDIETLLERLDGIILTGSRSNVQPSLYDGPPHAEGTLGGSGARRHDPAADPRRRGARRAAAGDLPRLAGAERRAWAARCTSGCRTCRTGSTIPRRCSRRTGCRTGKAHSVRLTPGGWLRRLAGADGNRGEFAAQPGDRTGWRPGWWWKPPRRTAPSRASAWFPPPPVPQRAMRSACSGIRNTTGRGTRVSRAIFADFAEAVRAYIAEEPLAALAAAE